MFYQILFVANATISHIASFLPLLAAARQQSLPPTTLLLSVAGEKKKRIQQNCPKYSLQKSVIQM